MKKKGVIEMDITFQIVKHSTEHKAGKAVKYKVTLAHKDGHRLTLVGDSESVKAGFPLGEEVDVSIRELATLDQFPQKKKQ